MQIKDLLFGGADGDSFGAEIGLVMLVFLLRGSGRYGIDAWFRKPEAEV